MKCYIVLISAVAAFFSLVACSQSEEQNVLEAVEEVSVASEWEGVWIFEFMPDEFMITIGDEKITVMQGNTALWIGTFNTNTPMGDDIVITSQRDPEAYLPYITAGTKTLDFLYNDGVLLYIDPVLETALDFKKVL